MAPATFLLLHISALGGWRAEAACPGVVVRGCWAGAPAAAPAPPGHRHLHRPDTSQFAETCARERACV